MNSNLSLAPLSTELLVVHLCHGEPMVNQAIQIAPDLWILSTGGWRCYPWAWTNVPVFPEMPSDARDCFPKQTYQKPKKIEIKLEDLDL